MSWWMVAAQAAASLAGGMLSRKTAQDERKNHFKNLRKSAQRGGFNPLTALYATQGGGYSQYAGILSRNPLEGALVSGANAYSSMTQNQQIRKHETKLANMEGALRTRLTRMNNDAVMGRQKHGQEHDYEMRMVDFWNQDQLNEAQFERRNEENIYKDYGSTIPVRIGTKMGEVDITVARKLKIRPGDRVVAEDLQAVFGEVWGEGTAAIFTKIGTEAMTGVLSRSKQSENLSIFGGGVTRQ